MQFEFQLPVPQFEEYRKVLEKDLNRSGDKNNDFKKLLNESDEPPKRPVYRLVLENKSTNFVASSTVEYLPALPQLVEDSNFANNFTETQNTPQKLFSTPLALVIKVQPPRWLTPTYNR